MRQFFLLLLLILSISINAQTGSIGINTSTPDNSSVLDIVSTNKGVLVPRMTTSARTSITSPANGLLVFDTTTNSLWVYKNSVWVEIISGVVSVNTQTSSYTLQPSDNGKIIEMNSASAILLTVPSGLPIGFQCSITQLGAGQVTFVGSGVTLRNAYGYTKTALQYSKAGVEIASSGDVILSGDLR